MQNHTVDLKATIQDDEPVMLNIVVDTATSTGQLFRLVQHVRPQWSQLHIIIKRFEEGVTNQTYGLFRKNASESESVDESESLLLKIYGKNTELLIDRQREIDLMKELSQHHLANRILLQFENGFIATYTPGRACTCEQIASHTVSLMIAQQMAKMHSVSLNITDPKPDLLSQIKKMMHQLNPTLPIVGDISTDLAHVESSIIPKLNLFNLDIVLCHNDLLPANIIYDEKHEKVSFIDFEFCSYNYWLYDIANHFGEYTDYFQHPDIDLYPSREFRKRWLKVYLSHRTLSTENRALDFDYLCDLIEIFTALSHLFWSLWLFIQVDVSRDNHFNCEKYAYMRFAKYLQFRKYLYPAEADV